MKHYLSKGNRIIKKSMAFLLTLSLLAQVGSIVVFAQSPDLLVNINYTMNGADVIEKMEFTDTDRSRVHMNRVIHTDGTAELTIIKNGKSSVKYFTNHDYNVFYTLANPTNKTNGKIAHNNDLLDGDIIGSQYKHIYVSSTNATIDNDAIGAIMVGGISTAASILMGQLALPGATAVSIAGLLLSAIASISPYRVEIAQTLYEVRFSFDDVYYTHCYHELIKSYDTGNHLIETRTEYHQSVGG